MGTQGTDVIVIMGADWAKMRAEEVRAQLGVGICSKCGLPVQSGVCDGCGLSMQAAESITKFLEKKVVDRELRKIDFCVDCGEGVPLTCLNQYPEYKGGDLEEIPKDEYEEFLAVHGNHNREELVGVDFLGPWPISRQDWREPVREDLFPVKNAAGEVFIMRRWREKIYDPFCYELLHGRISLRVVDVRFCAEDILAHLRFKRSLVSADTLSDFIEGVQLKLEEEATGVLEDFINELYRPSSENISNPVNPLVFCFRHKGMYEAIKDLVERSHFSQSEKSFFLSFIEEDSLKPDGILGLEVKMDFTHLLSVK